MNISIFTSDDLEQIFEHEMTPEKVLGQVDKFVKGIPFTKIIKPCTVNDGITILSDNDIEDYIRIFDARSDSRCMKFVPASGAATRMFKLLLSAYNEIKSDDSFQQNNLDDTLLSFIKGLDKYAFFNNLKNKMKEENEDLEDCIKTGQIKKIFEYILIEKGLNLSNMPKGMIPFHRYNDHIRTPFEEQLVEALNLIKDENGKIKIHFTVSSEHEIKVKEFIGNVLDKYENNDFEYEIGYSCQKPSSDTIAVDHDNMPFRDENGFIIFRPGGHGALIENLSDLEGDIIFIKNIDNIVTDKFKHLTYKYKKALGGLLISLQQEIFGYIEILKEDRADDAFFEMLFSFIRKRLSVIPSSGILNGSHDEKKEYLLGVLDRPLRVCGMVENTGAPGGGPFWVEKSGEGVSIQIVETSQINRDLADQEQILHAATHFNPVDLVCGLRDHNGNPFDLKKYVDNDAGFISKKSKNGKELKALELPGLWNGSMAYWNTVFVEVPADTFAPVKTVFDLMDEKHQE